MAIYLNVKGFSGSVTEKGHEQWIECHDMNWSVSRNIDSKVGAGKERESSAPTVSEVMVSRNMDQCSPELALEACVGKSKPVIIHFVQTGESELEVFMEYKLENALISSYSISHHGDGTPVESVSFNFTKVEMSYTPYGSDHKSTGPQTGDV